jgi:hypothetical protein
VTPSCPLTIDGAARLISRAMAVIPAIRDNHLDLVPIIEQPPLG